MIASAMAEIRQFVIDNFLFGEDEEHLSDDTPLLEAGIVDSVGLMGIVAFLQTSYAIELDQADITPDNFRSINHIAKLLEEKRMLPKA